MVTIFWMSALGILYSYVLYPVLLLAISPRKTVSRDHDNGELPGVSLIITVHNEASRIADKLENALQIDYPAEKFEILVASDCSTDATDTLVKTYANRGVRLIRAEQRKGKEFAQKLAVDAASKPVLVFSDAGTRIPSGSIKAMVRNFADDRVGAVSSEDRFISNDGKIVGEGLYVKYEMWLRRLESSVNSLVGLSGSFFAVRRSICDDWDISIPSDFSCALNSVRSGHFAVSDPNVVGEYKDIKDSRSEYPRKVRTIIRGMSAVAAKPDVLNPFRFGLFAFQVLSHKLMRWAVPWLLLACLISNCAIAGQHDFYRGTLVIQLTAYALATLGFVSVRSHRSPAVRVPYYFLQANIAAAHALIAFVRGKRMTTWTPSSR